MKLQILVVEPSEQVRSILQRNFENQFGAEVIQSSSSSEAVNILDSGEFFDLIVTRNEFDDVQLANILLNYIYDHSLKTPLIVIGDFEHSLKKMAFVSPKPRIEEINRLCLRALNLKKENFKSLKLPDFIPYPTHYLYPMKFTPCDIYIRLVKKEGDEYVKRFNEDEEFSRADIAKYEELGLKEFFVLKDETVEFTNALIGQSLNKVKESAPEQINEVLDSTFSISMDMIRKVGITPEAKVLADRTIAEIDQQVSKSELFSSLLKRILDDKFSFSYRRSYLTSLIAASIIPQLDWGGVENYPQMLHKITMVCFFHDVYLEDERLLKVMDSTALKSQEFVKNLDEKNMVINHAHKAASLMQSYAKLPTGVDLVIKQHHGSSNGVGFPEQLTSALSPMTILFIVVEDFANKVLTSEKINLEKIMEELTLKYTLPSYKRIVTEIKHLTRPRKPKK